LFAPECWLLAAAALLFCAMLPVAWLFVALPFERAKVSLLAGGRGTLWVDDPWELVADEFKPWLAVAVPPAEGGRGT
jgi:hypothetical protein